MNDISWPHKQALYLKGTGLGYWFGSNAPAALIYLILQNNEFSHFKYWIMATIVASTISFVWRRKAYDLLVNGEITWFGFNAISVAVLTVKASLWAYISCAVFPNVGVQEQSFICMMITGIAAGSLPINASSRLLSRLTILAILTPLALGAHLSPSSYGDLIGMAILVYIAVLIKASNVFHNTLKNEFDTAVHNHYLRRQLEEKTASLVTQAQHASLGEMAGNMAHEINNPLTTLTANIDLLKIRLDQKNSDRGQIDSVIEKMQSNIQRVTKIIKSLRHFSRNTSYDEFADEKVNLIFGQTVLLCQERMEAEGIELMVRSCPENLTIECRAPEICHALLNLINNSRDAIEHLDKKWIRIESIDHGHTVEIRVTDSGKGIGEKISDKIMEPFFTTKEIGKGVGLGLSVAQAIIKAHSGTIELDKHSENTCFIIRLPTKIVNRSPMSFSA